MEKKLEVPRRFHHPGPYHTRCIDGERSAAPVISLGLLIVFRSAYRNFQPVAYTLIVPLFVPFV
jgi:hypothetical protein